jgi:hypothetical protein
MAGGGRDEKRRKRRVRRRIPCELVTSDRRFTGIVLDVSVDGMFVQTSAVLPAGTELRVRVLSTSSTPAFELDARVARAKRVPPQLVSSAAGGMGLRVLRPPAEFAALQAGGGEEGVTETPAAAPRPAPSQRPIPAAPPAPASRRAPATPPTPPPAPTGPTFRVRLKQKSGDRSRLLVVVAPDPAAARKKALSDIGAGWDVLEVERAEG